MANARHPVRRKFMRVLGIETTCDETAVAIVEDSGKREAERYFQMGIA